ncbi:MAG: hypothetical protein HY053_09440 [Proteobacteria bacterium]|nr:hypothetical protein [Pseudomonadota bacterium]
MKILSRDNKGWKFLGGRITGGTNYAWANLASAASVLALFAGTVDEVARWTTGHSTGVGPQVQGAGVWTFMGLILISSTGITERPPQLPSIAGGPQ